MKRWRRVAIIQTLIALICICAFPPAAKAQESTIRIVVKVRAGLATDIDSALTQPQIALAAGASGNPRVEGFLSRHQVRTMGALYPDLVRLKKTGLTDLQIAVATQQKFSTRGRRLRGRFQPPEISRTYVLQFDGGAGTLLPILNALRADPDVEYAEEDHLIRTNATENDPYLSSSGTWGQSYPDLWGIQKIGAPAAWNTSTGSGVVVAVVDTGIDYNHPDIAANVWTNTKEIAGNGIDDDHNGYVDDIRGWDFIGSTYTNPQQSNNPIDHFGHGTHVAGTIAAVGNNGIGVIGVAWNAHVMAVKALDDSGTGTDSTLSQGILYAANNGADVISASWGAQGSSQTIADAVNYAYNLGAVFVAAAGNSSEDALNFSPANLWNVITVAASDPNDNLASFSDYGSKIDVAAPGVDILSLQASGTQLGPVVSPGYIRLSGTSMATPHVSGLAALILSANPEYSNEDVRQAVRSSATDVGAAGYDLSFGYGRENAAAAVGVVGALEAKISSPLDGTVVQGAVSVSGVARGTGFSHYTLEYGSGSLPTSWTTLQTGNAAVSGLLGTFNPASLADSTYDLRLTVYNTAGQTFVDRVQVVANPIFILSPSTPPAPISATTFKNGTAISVTGNAVGANFQNFKVDWAPGLDATSGWQATGITLAGGGTAAVVAGPLASWDTSSIINSGYYTIRLTVNAANTTRQVVTIVYLDPSLLSPNWPQFVNQGPGLNAGVVPALNADGTLRLLMEGPNQGGTGEFWSFGLSGPPQATPQSGTGGFMQPTVAPFLGNGAEQAAVIDFSDLDLIHEDGSLSVLARNSNVWYVGSQTIAADLLGNNNWEIVGYGLDYNTSAAYVSAWRPDGTPLNSNFPIRLTMQNPSDGALDRNPVLVGDIDGDGKKEIVAMEDVSSSTFTLRLFANDGSPLTWKVPALPGILSAMAAADFDGNGMLETVVAANTSTQTLLHVFQPDGSERAGWPLTFANSGTSTQNYLAIGDLNRDGNKEIVYAHSGYLYVFKANGTVLSNAWPLNAGTGLGSAFGYNALTIGDVDGDGFPEIVTVLNTLASTADPFFTVSSYGNEKLLAIRRDGTVSRSWQLNASNGCLTQFYPAPSIGDFNQDGITDIAVAYDVAYKSCSVSNTTAGIVTVLSTGAAFNPALNDWPLVRHDSRNTSVLPSSIVRPVNSASFIGADSATAGNWQTKYGADGYSLAGSVQKLPTYDPTFAVQNQSNWTWAASTPDPRALQLPGSNSGIAATWFSGSNFSFDVNVGASPQQIAIYALDWDDGHRSETVQIVDANNPSNALDVTRTISGFDNGIYLVWNVTGHVKVVVTYSGGLNAVVSGVFFGMGSSIPTAPVIVQQPQSATVSEGAAVTFSVAASGTNLNYQWQMVAPGDSNFTPVSGATTSTYTIPAVVLGISGFQFRCAVANSQGAVFSNGATLTVVSAGSTATYVTGKTLGTLRNDFTGWVGMRFTVGASPVAVAALGRIFVAGNNGSHLMKIVDAATGQDVSGSSANISTAGGIAGNFSYVNLPASVQLNANATYYVVSQETAGGDQWYDYNTALQTGSVAAEIGSVWSSNGSSYHLAGSAGQSYGPVDFQYVVVLSSPVITQEPQDITVNAGASATFSVAATGYGLTYQWQIEFGDGSFANIDGAVGSSFTISAPTLHQTGNRYRCIVNGTVTSTAATLTVVQGPSSTDYVTSETLGTPRNDFSGWVGMAVTVGGSPVSVSSLGRMTLSGNSGTHMVKIVTASGQDVIGGAVNINTSGATAGTFSYATLSAPIALQANTTYYIVSQETQGGDQWYDVNTSVQTASIAAETSGVWSPDGSAYHLAGSAAHTYGPVDFQYVPATSASFVTGVTASILRTDFTGWVGAKIATGASAVTVTQLGRYFIAGNHQTHTVKIVDAATGTDVAGGSVAVNMTGGQAGFVYANLAAPIVLNPHSAYYMVTQETQGGDQWYDYTNLSAATSNVATITSAIWSSDGVTYGQTGSTNQMYGPVSFVYSLQ